MGENRSILQWGPWLCTPTGKIHPPAASHEPIWPIQAVAPWLGPIPFCVHISTLYMGPCSLNPTFLFVGVLVVGRRDYFPNSIHMISSLHPAFFCGWIPKTWKTLEIFQRQELQNCSTAPCAANPTLLRWGRCR